METTAIDFPYTIRYWGDPSTTGYGYALRGYVQAFQQLGIGSKQVWVVPAISALTGLSAPVDDWLTRSYLKGADRPERKDVNIVHLHPPHLVRFWTQGYYNVAITAWETDKLPDGKFSDAEGNLVTVVDALNRFDEVWVPTEDVYDVFRGSGVQVERMHVIPHALQPSVFAYRPRDRWPQVGDLHPALNPPASPSASPEGIVRFYYIGSWDARKNVQTLLRAYALTGWNPSTPVELVLHCTPPSRDPHVVLTHEWMAQRGLEELRASLPDPMSCPNFALLTKPRTESWLHDLHQSGHVFVTASRAEGFCLPALDALAFGNLVIGTQRAVGHFAHGGVISVDEQLTEIEPMAHVAGYELDQRWWNPSLWGLSNAFKRAFEVVRSGVYDLTPESIRRTYSPSSIAAMMRPRVEHWKHVLSNTGW